MTLGGREGDRDRAKISVEIYGVHFAALLVFCWCIIIEMKSKRFFDFFPPPTFLTMPAAGISIESDALRVISFEEKHGHRTLCISAEIPLDKGAIVDGAIALPDKVLKALQKIHDDHGVRFARVSVPEEKAYVYESVIPMPEDGEIRDAVEFSLDQNIPITASEAVFDFAVIEGPFTNNDVLSVRVVVIAYPTEIVSTWVELLKQAGITPLAMMPESQAIARSLVPTDDKKTSLIAHFLKEKTVIAIVSGGFVRFSTTVANALDNANKILDSHEGEKIAESVELLAVRDEVKKVYAYWMSTGGAKSRKDPSAVKSLIVSGHVAHMSDVSDYLGKHVGVPAFLGSVWQNVFSLNDVVPTIEFEDSLRYAAAVGATFPY